jgi:hypothetical protein
MIKTRYRLEKRIDSAFQPPEGGRNEYEASRACAERELLEFSKKSIDSLDIADLCEHSFELINSSANLKYNLMKRIMFILLKEEEFPDFLGLYFNFFLNEILYPEKSVDKSVAVMLKDMSSDQLSTISDWLDFLARENEGLFYESERKLILGNVHRQRIEQILNG